MTWLVWRQHRQQAAWAVLVLGSLAVALTLTEHSITDYLSSSGLTSCVLHHGECFDLDKALNAKFGPLLNAVPYLNFLPLLVGIFWGAPLVAREFEQGTNRLAWTQSVSRRRWLTVQLLTATIAAGLAAAAFTALVGWWYHTVAPIQGYGPLDPTVFDLHGIVPIGYTLFALAVGVAAGVVLRRTLPAIGVTIAAFLGLRFGFAMGIRPHLFPADHIRYLVNTTSPRSGLGDWVIHTGMVDGAGHPLQLARLVNTCPATGNKPALQACLANHHFYQLDIYQPANRYWAFQGVEFGTYLLLTLILIAVAIYWTLRRTR